MTKNMVVGESVYGEKRISVEVRLYITTTIADLCCIVVKTICFITGIFVCLSNIRAPLHLEDFKSPGLVKSTPTVSGVVV